MHAVTITEKNQATCICGWAGTRYGAGPASGSRGQGAAKEGALHMEPVATDAQVAEQASAIASQAQAIADGKVPADQLRAQVLRLERNLEILKAWTPSI